MALFSMLRFNDGKILKKMAYILAIASMTCFLRDSSDSLFFLLPLPVLSIDPVIGAIAAGNTVVLKPSEVATATSSFLAKNLPQYVDNSCIRVVEGSIPEASALLEQKWDKIFYTGLTYYPCLTPKMITHKRAS